MFAGLLRPPRVSPGEDHLVDKVEWSSRSSSELTKDTHTKDRYSTLAESNSESSSPSSIFHWRFWILIAANLMWGLSVSVFLVLVPRYAEQNGVPAYQIATVFTAYGCVSVGFRITSIAISKYAVSIQ